MARPHSTSTGGARAAIAPFTRFELVLALALALVLAAAGCGRPRYAYAPTHVTSADVVGAPAARHPIPPDAPRGDVRVATFGITDIRKGGKDVRAVHVRLVVSNQSEQPWSVDGAAQFVHVEEAVTAMRAVTMEGAPPGTFSIEPGSTSVVDLFFPLPPALKDPRELESFDVVWNVRAGDRSVTERTPFERFRAVRPPLETRPEDRAGAPRASSPPVPDPNVPPGAPAVQRWRTPQPTDPRAPQ